jgi:excisionase family DNA binding protein
MSTQTIPVPVGLISINEAALVCGVHKNTIRSYIKTGKLPAVRLGERNIRINAADLQALFTPVVAGEYSAWNRH